MEIIGVSLTSMISYNPQHRTTFYRLACLTDGKFKWVYIASSPAKINAMYKNAIFYKLDFSDPRWQTICANFVDSDLDNPISGDIEKWISTQ